MTTPTLLIDGMVSGTGIRDAINGGYLRPDEVRLSAELSRALSQWVSKYEQAQFHAYEDRDAVSSLDQEGMALAKRIAAAKPDHSVGYFSDALMPRLEINSIL